MNTNKFLIGGIIAAVVYFFLGWLIWGMLLKSFFAEHTNEAAKAIMRREDNMVWWAMVAGCLFWGLMISYVLLKSGVNSAARGATVGAVVTFLISASMNCYFYAQMTIGDTASMIVDILVTTILGGILGAIIGWYFGRTNRAANI